MVVPFGEFKKFGDNEEDQDELTEDSKISDETEDVAVNLERGASCDVLVEFWLVRDLEPEFPDCVGCEEKVKGLEGVIETVIRSFKMLNREQHSNSKNYKNYKK